ncbi:MAG: cytochrome c [Cytophagales bacterium]|nr:cytochrome c [Cytophagales bacterium]
MFFCLIFLGWGLSGCRSKESSVKKKHVLEGLDRRTKLRFKSYFAKGHVLYQRHCSNCHQSSGKGIKSWIPPLKNSDYLLRNPKRNICIIRYGQDSIIRVNGKKYDSPMPGFPQLSSLEIAEIITYVQNAWGNRGGFLSVKEVQMYLERDSCRVRF